MYSSDIFDMDDSKVIMFHSWCKIHKKCTRLKFNMEPENDGFQ